VEKQHRMKITRTMRRTLGATAAVSVAFAAPLATASAEQSSSETRVVDSSPDGAQRELVTVYSPSMDLDIPLDVLRPADRDTPAPVLYLLNGAGGGEGPGGWPSRTNYQEFFADKHVNVVTPRKGAFSYYTDWQKPDKVLGTQKWQTFLTKELPPVLNAYLNANGKNAVAGISMAGTSVFNLAIAAPGLYTAAAGYSGCARTSDALGQQYVRLVVEERGGGDARNMWGPYGGPGWTANDPYVNAEKLRGTAIYLSSNTGLPGQDETIEPDSTTEERVDLADRVVVGGGVEAATNVCTQQMGKRLAELKIPAEVRIRPTGTHSWPYWERELDYSWPLIERSLDR
jgi:diacylglycerol O-acyltransferase/trehalose O-mycolyltransferase